jgi:hypothetical protein
MARELKLILPSPPDRVGRALSGNGGNRYELNERVNQ